MRLVSQGGNTNAALPDGVRDSGEHEGVWGESFPPAGAGQRPDEGMGSEFQIEFKTFKIADETALVVSDWIEVNALVVNTNTYENFIRVIFELFNSGNNFFFGSGVMAFK